MLDILETGGKVFAPILRVWRSVKDQITDGDNSGDDAVALGEVIAAEVAPVVFYLGDDRVVIGERALKHLLAGVALIARKVYLAKAV